MSVDLDLRVRMVVMGEHDILGHPFSCDPEDACLIDQALRQHLPGQIHLAVVTEAACDFCGGFGKWAEDAHDPLTPCTCCVEGRALQPLERWREVQP